MKLPLYIRVPAELIHNLLAAGTRPSNSWFRTIVTLTARMLDGRLDALGQMRETAAAIARCAGELEWSWRRLDLCTGEHPGDRDLGRLIQENHDSTERDLGEALRQVAILGDQLAAGLKTTSANLLQRRTAADKAALQIFSLAPPASSSPLPGPHALALLAVACDIVPPPPAEQFAPVLEIALAQKLVAPAFVPDSVLAAAPQTKHLATKGKVMKLGLTADEHELVDDVCGLASMPINRLAVLAIGAHIQRADPMDEVTFDGLREIVITLDALLHTAVACGVAARHGLLHPRTDHELLNRIDKLAWKVYGAGASRLQLVCGAAIRHAPDFQAAVEPLIERAAVMRHAPASRPPSPACTALLDYLVGLRILT